MQRIWKALTLCSFILGLRRLQSCPLWNPSLMSLGFLSTPWWRRMWALRSRTSGLTSKGRFSWIKRFLFFFLITGNSCGLLWNSKQTLLKPVLSCVISHCVRTKVIFDQNCFSSAWPFKGFMRFFAEALLWTPWEEDGSVGIPPSWGVDERPEGLSEGLHGKCFGRGICSWWSLCDWKRRAGKSLSISYEFGDKSTFPQC